MTVLEIAKELISLCQTGQNFAAMEKLYSDDIASVEGDGSAPFVGKAVVIKKSADWVAAHEVHSGSVSGPFVHGNQFMVRFTFDVTIKANGHRMTMDEMGLYTVADEKIVREEFFYAQA